ncbi:hypothetical protein RJ639_020771 [Escallonia herrerae]|uniref:Peptidase C1A papain C-terminal domain-containing protein n=1 Tax=Escallonia herrerae TaxID=1293975 RepID=A0AA88V6B3_9ASTE|nr:hypothetical protein RJ639_020771 [Escallonia herrerae]
MAASGATESLLAMVYGRQLCLSVQEVVDCHAGHDCKEGGRVVDVFCEKFLGYEIDEDGNVILILKIFWGHSVLITGYEIDEDENVILIVKNSWGHSVLITGYGKMEMLSSQLKILGAINGAFMDTFSLKEALVTAAAAAECWSKMARVYTRHPDILSSSPSRILTPADFPQKVITPDGVPEYTFAECEEWRLPVPDLEGQSMEDDYSRGVNSCGFEKATSRSFKVLLDEFVQSSKHHL